MFNRIYPRPVLINSIPKCGTNLVKNIILAVPGMEYVSDLSLATQLSPSEDLYRYVRSRITTACGVYEGHIPFDEKVNQWLTDRGFRILFIYRDPRDYTVSLQKFIMRDVTPKHDYYDLLHSLENDRERLLATIQGIGEGRLGKFGFSKTSMPHVRAVYDAFMPWATQPHVLAVRYEDFVNSEGNRSITAIATMKRIMEFLHLNYTDEQLEQTLDTGMDPRRSATYRKGRAGGWVDDYEDIHISRFDRIAGDLLVELGYV